MKFPTKPVGAKRAAQQMMTEDQLGESIRDACKQLGWQFYWLRKTQHSSEGILDLWLIPIIHLERRHILNRELKGHDARGRLGELSPAQVITIDLANAAGGDAAKWEPANWFSGKILEELR